MDTKNARTGLFILALILAASLTPTVAFSQALYRGEGAKSQRTPGRLSFCTKFPARFGSDALAWTPPRNSRGTDWARGSGGISPLFAAWDEGGGGGGGIERLEFTISPSGLVTEKVTGVTGPSCKIVTEEVRAGRFRGLLRRARFSGGCAHAGHGVKPTTAVLSFVRVEYLAVCKSLVSFVSLTSALRLYLAQINKMLGEVMQEESTSEMFEEVLYENNTLEEKESSSW